MKLDPQTRELVPESPEDLVEYLKRCTEDRLYFEICPEDADVLYAYIRKLDPRV